MVGVGNCCGNCTACQLGVVELGFPGVGAREYDPQCNATKTVKERPFTQLVKARILMEHRWQDGAHHEVLDCGVGEGGPVALPIALKALSVAGIIIFSLIDSGDKAHVRVLEGVERSQGHQLEFLSSCKRRDIL